MSSLTMRRKKAMENPAPQKVSREFFLNLYRTGRFRGPDFLALLDLAFPAAPYCEEDGAEDHPWDAIFVEEAEEAEEDE